jgi:hypothetical protein
MLLIAVVLNDLTSSLLFMIRHSVHCDPPRNAFLLSPLFLFFLSLTSNKYMLGILVIFFFFFLHFRNNLEPG